jgi:hypothetical protein
MYKNKIKCINNIFIDFSKKSFNYKKMNMEQTKYHVIYIYSGLHKRIVKMYMLSSF